MTYLISYSTAKKAKENQDVFSKQKGKNINFKKNKIPDCPVKAFELKLCNYTLQSPGWHKTVCLSGTTSSFPPTTSVSVACT